MERLEFESWRDRKSLDATGALRPPGKLLLGGRRGQNPSDRSRAGCRRRRAPGRRRPGLGSVADIINCAAARHGKWDLLPSISTLSRPQDPGLAWAPASSSKQNSKVGGSTMKRGPGFLRLARRWPGSCRSWNGGGHPWTTTRTAAHGPVHRSGSQYRAGNGT